MIQRVENLSNAGSTKMGTAGGLAAVLLFSISSGELLKTAILAGFGAIVSFTVSVAIKWLLPKLRRKP